MSILTYQTLMRIGKAYELKTKESIDMFDDLWEVYQVGNKYRRDNESAIKKEVAKSYATLAATVKKRASVDSGNAFNRVSQTTADNLVIFSDIHMTYRGHRHDYFHSFNYDSYCTLLKKYSDRGFSLVENGDVEELLIFDPTKVETEKRRKLVKKSLLVNDIGTINWDELVGVRIEQRKKQLEKIFRDNKPYYDIVRGSFGKSRYHKLAGNHDTYYSPELEGMIEAQLWPSVVKDILLVERNNAPAFAVTHGHQFDEACVPPYAKMVGEVISECLSWAYQGPDRIWKTSDTRQWTSQAKKEFGNVLSSLTAKDAKVSGHPDLEAVLECFMGHQVAWEYFENSDPYMAFVKEVCTGDEFFKYRHMDEDALANGLLRQNPNLTSFPTVICGHSHEVRDRSKFRNTGSVLPPDTRDKNLFTRYINSGSAGRFENLIWCVEIKGNKANVYSWSNSGTKERPVLKKVLWTSDERGKLIGRDVAEQG
jgi:hypothetical protein